MQSACSHRLTVSTVEEHLTLSPQGQRLSCPARSDMFAVLVLQVKYSLLKL